MTVPWDVASLWSYEKVSGAEPLDAANESQPIAGVTLANEAPAATGAPRGGGWGERGGGVAELSRCVEFVRALQGGTCSAKEF